MTQQKNIWNEEHYWKVYDHKTEQEYCESFMTDFLGTIINVNEVRKENELVKTKET